MDYFVKSYRVTVNTPTWAVLGREVEHRLAEGRGFAIATLNLDHLVKLAMSVELRDAYAAQDVVVADGNPIVWMSRLAGKPVDLIPGSDAIVPLCRIAARQGVSIALVGSTDATLKTAAAHLQDVVPGLKVAIRISPEFGFDPKGASAKRIFERLTRSGAGLCFVALGAPKQEIFAAQGRIHAPHVGFASIGAGLDFFAGAQERAPRWMRKLAMEWLYRMLANPARLAPRYARCIAILPRQALQAAAQRFAPLGPVRDLHAPRLRAAPQHRHVLDPLLQAARR